LDFSGSEKELGEGGLQQPIFDFALGESPAFGFASIEPGLPTVVR
jgi:hypothetical protein